MTRLNYVLFVLLFVVAITAYVLTPKQIIASSHDESLSSLLPHVLGDWEEVTNNNVQVDLVPRKDGKPIPFGPYDDSLARTYKNRNGDLVMLSLAYGRTQKQEVKIHRPELCYVAQGFLAKNLTETNFGKMRYSSDDVIGKNMLAESPGRLEAVSYWIRIGDVYSRNAWQTRYYIFKKGISGFVPDGILVRVSSLVKEDSEVQNGWALNKQFMADLVQYSSKDLRQLLIHE